MVVNKRSKKSRARGEWTHGWGAKKKHRGAGNRGGRGNAGSGKRADQKNPTYQKIPNYFGKFGFGKRLKGEPLATINVGYLDLQADTLVKRGLATKHDGTYTIDISKLKAHKLLGAGIVRKKLAITALIATQGAIDKVQKTGGSVKALVSGSDSDDDAKKEEKAEKGKANK